MKRRKRPSYRGEPYWEKEKPEEVRTARLWLSYYPQAGKLQISQLWQKDGQDIRGKTVTLDQEDFALHPDAGGLLRRALEGWE